MVINYREIMEIVNDNLIRFIYLFIYVIIISVMLTRW